MSHVGRAVASLFAQGSKLQDFLSAEEVTLSFHLLQCVSRFGEILEARTVEVKLDPPEGRFLLALSRNASRGIGTLPTPGSTFLLLTSATLTGGCARRPLDQPQEHGAA